jgi:hypothetical protein
MVGIEKLSKLLNLLDPVLSTAKCLCVLVSLSEGRDVIVVFLFIFWWDWGLNSGLHACRASPPVHFALEMEVLQITPPPKDWFGATILQILASQVPAPDFCWFVYWQYWDLNSGPLFARWARYQFIHTPNLFLP